MGVCCYTSYIAGFAALGFYYLFNALRRRGDITTFFRGKTVLITGSSSGLGRSFACVLYRMGANIIIAARRVEELQKLRDELVQSSGGKPGQDSAWPAAPICLPLDIEKLAVDTKYRELTLGALPHIDVLISNAGVSARGSILDSEVTTHQSVMNTNYIGHIALVRAALLQMVDRNSGVICGISSLQGQLALPNRSAYAASKHALQAFYDSLRLEIADTNILVHLCCPGYIKTNFSLNALTGSGEKYSKVDEIYSTGMEPEMVVTKTLQSIVAGDAEVFIGPIHHRLAAVLRVLFPWLYSLVIGYWAKRNVKKA